MRKYTEVGLIISLVCMIFLFALAWVINGVTTAWAVVTVITSGMEAASKLSGKTIAPGSELWIIGMLIHFAVSSIEQHLWRLRNRRLIPMIVVVGFVDIFTAAYGVEAVAGVYGVSMSHGWSTLIGLAVAILPELMIVVAVQALQQLKGSEYVD